MTRIRRPVTGPSLCYTRERVFARNACRPLTTRNTRNTRNIFSNRRVYRKMGSIQRLFSNGYDEATHNPRNKSVSSGLAFVNAPDRYSQILRARSMEGRCYE